MEIMVEMQIMQEEAVEEEAQVVPVEVQMEIMEEMVEMVLIYLLLMIIIMVPEEAEVPVIVAKVIGPRVQDLMLEQEVKEVVVMEEDEQTQLVLMENNILVVVEVGLLIQKPETEDLVLLL